MGSQGFLLLMELKIFDNDDQAAKHYCCLPLILSSWEVIVMFCGLVIIIKNFNKITSFCISG